ncbi:DUF4142 domain-containing protein [Mucilaginibacter ginkgonis]|uniref:DUF4142 domain-containing protein n=1 Tax=Mucilaginibacter ginkgonis TaxID=2682091 RepID=A0A7T7JGD8_9SPHI|nr:DUF4142 domain-containing protein [Mucilaginibacter ginkgonis]QQL49435.1 DUF4142 domain-containing protein [Mucilaginibacter ginkgonis]
MKNIITTIILGCFGYCAHAQIPQPDPDTTAKHFLTVASIGNLQEVSAAQIALKSSNNADVTSFAKMMVQDHSRSEQQLMQLASRKGYNLPPAATGNIQPDLQLMEAGNKIDPLYVHKMVSAHNNTVQTFENYATVGKDPDVRKFAQDMLPALRHHLMEIKEIEMKMSAK